MIFFRLCAADLDAVAVLEQAAGDVRWSREQFARELELPASRFFVLKEENDLLGYGGYWKVSDEAQITNLVVRPDRRRQGLGRNLLRHLLETARTEQCHSCTLELRAHNIAARRLYEAEGFREMGRRKGIYQTPAEDAVLMTKQW